MKTKASEVLRHSRGLCGLLLAICVFIGPARRLSAWAKRVKDQPGIRVWIYNYAHVGRIGLSEAEGEAARIFARAGVRIVWTDYSHEQRGDRGQAENSDADFFIRILPASMARQWNYKPRSLGESVISPTAEGPLPGGIANVFSDRVEHMSYLWDLDSGEILGDAIAHELGHLLLGANHSGQGIMKAQWGVQDLELARRGELLFLPTETSPIQRASRSLHPNSSLIAAAQR